ncbi:mutator protein [Hordeum vulgare]|nr:mutator protein [Hordeum vulgare]
MRMVWLLNDVYDVEHRAYLMSEKKMELMPLKIRSHGASTVMQYDERYTPYIEMTGLLPFIQLLDDVCRTSTKDGGVGGCMLILSVEWQPYGAGPNFGDAHTFELNPLCL